MSRMNNEILIQNEDREHPISESLSRLTGREWIEKKSMYTSGIHTQEQFHRYMCFQLITNRLEELGYHGTW
jgi:hypothetical protein